MTRSGARLQPVQSELARHGWWLATSTALAIVGGTVLGVLLPALVYVGVNNIGAWLYLDQFPTGHLGWWSRLAPYLAAVLLPVGLPLVVLGTNGPYADRSFEHTVQKDYVDPPPPSPSA